MPASNAEREQPVSTPSRYQKRSFRIRAAQPKDLAQIVTVLLTSFYAQAKATHWLYWLLRMGIQEDIRVKIKSPAGQYACVVATTLHPTSAQSGAVIGTAEVSQRPCETWQLFPPKRAYLSNLAIDPAYRREGVAQQLIATCESVALSWGFHSVYLHVMADNVAAQALYARAGYQQREVSNPVLSRLGIRTQRLLLSKRVSKMASKMTLENSSKNQL
ncbi:MAG: GNAT family N-acetyltransferase [Phormidesmis sp.]